MDTIKILDDYELKIAGGVKTAIVGEIIHFCTTPIGTTHSVEVGKLSARSDKGDNDAFRPHWKVWIFLESGFEYDPTNRITISPKMMERSHWRAEGLTVAEGSLPKYHPDLPDAAVRSLVDLGLCTEPIWAQVYCCEIDHVLNGYGELMWD